VVVLASLEEQFADVHPQFLIAVEVLEHLVEELARGIVLAFQDQLMALGQPLLLATFLFGQQFFGILDRAFLQFAQ
jgi:hypothetical protein